MVCPTCKKMFEYHKKLWKEQTMFYSDPSMINNNSHLQSIIAMKDVSVSLILKDIMEGKLNWWFDALMEMTNANPMKPENAGRLQELSKDWLVWGSENGYEH